MYNPRVYKQLFTVFPKNIIFRAGVALVLTRFLALQVTMELFQEDGQCPLEVKREMALR